MKIRQNLARFTSEHLVMRFAEIGIEQDNALLRNEIGSFNKLYDEKAAILAELKNASQRWPTSPSADPLATTWSQVCGR